MTHDQDTRAFLDLIETYRLTLTHFIKQSAHYGGEAFVPPQIAHGIRDARTNIAYIKKALREQGIQIEDNLYDEMLPVQSHSSDKPLAQELSLTNKLQIDAVIDSWLKSKYKRSQSNRTVGAYAENFRSFCVELQEVGLGINGNAYSIALVLLRWSGISNNGKKVSDSTYNQRLSIVSSFYIFARKSGLIDINNPADLLDRRRVQKYANAVISLDLEEVQQRLLSIDRSTAIGARDHALLAVALATGRRISELSMLKLGDISISGKSVTLIWRRTRGGKAMTDQLPFEVGRSLLEYLSLAYGAQFAKFAPSASVWLSFSPVSKGKPLGMTGMRGICEKHFGVTTFNSLRYTFAKIMQDAGSSAEKIQEKMGHTNLGTTSHYLQTLHSIDNPYAMEIVKLLGLDS